MKILLIQPPWYGFQNIISNRLHLGLAYIAAVLEKNGDQVLLLNGETFFKDLKQQPEKMVIDEQEYLKNFTENHYVYAAIIEAASEFMPEAIGLSFMTANSPSAYILAKKLKRSFPKAALIAGGVHPTLLPEEPLRQGGFDLVVRGEGEATIVELVQAFKNSLPLDNILGLTYRHNAKIKTNPDRPLLADLDSLPFPAFHLMKDHEKNIYACKGITASRGCPFGCTYCASKLIWSRQVRFRSPENVIAEIVDRHQRLGITAFGFHDDTFTLKPDFVKKFCRLALGLDFKISWHCDTRGDTLDQPLLKLMKRAGCQHIYLGLESGSPKIQRLIKKNLPTETVRRAVAMARRVGIVTTVYFMIGFPEETEEDIQLSLKAMEDIKPDYAIWGILTPYPGTEIGQLALRDGLINNDANWTNFFHHFNQGNIFGSISREVWDKMLKAVETEQNKLNGRLTVTKVKVKIKDNFNLIKLALKNPKKILPYIKKHF